MSEDIQNNEFYTNIKNSIQNFTIDKFKKEAAKDWENFAETVMNEVDSELTGKVTIDDLRTQSRTFLQRIKEIDLLAENTIKDKQFSNSGLTKSINKNTKLHTIQVRLWYAAAFSYSRYIHKFLGLPLAKAIVVFDAKKDKRSGEVFSKEIYMSDLIRSTGSYGTFHIKYLNELQSSTTKKEQNEIVKKEFRTLEEQLKQEYKTKEKQNQIDRHIKNVQSAYQYIAQHSEKKDSNYFQIVLPKEKNPDPKKAGSFGTYMFLNYGDLKEAYAAALIEKHIDNSIADPLCQETGVSESFLATIFFKNYVTRVDNKGALLGEDIIAHHRKMQYAVKATNAHLPSLKQYIDFANNFINSKNITKKAIQEMANSWEEENATGRKKGQRNREIIKKEAENVANQFENTIKKS